MCIIYYFYFFICSDAIFMHVTSTNGVQMSATIANYDTSCIYTYTSNIYTSWTHWALTIDAANKWSWYLNGVLIANFTCGWHYNLEARPRCGLGKALHPAATDGLVAQQF